jgi:PAS domain S-box-containing protein/diguanylate cyclase (GGDEF)-like protein
LSDAVRSRGRDSRAGHVKSGGAHADVDLVSSPASQELLAAPDPEPLAHAGLHELPDALVFGFDTDLCLTVAAGRALPRGEAGGFVPGQSVAEALPEPLRHALEPLLRSALTGETRTREIWTAAEHCLSVDVGPLRPDTGADGIVGGVAVVMDTSTRRRAELLAASGPTPGLEDAAERSLVGTGLIDRDGRWLLVNRALCEITGYTEEELIGKRFEGIVHPDDAFADAQLRSRLDAGEIPAYEVEKRYFDASGETVTAVMTISLVRDRDGRPLYHLAQLRDVSERRQLEDQLRRLGDHDPLTGLRNRRLFLHDLHLQVARSQRYGEVAGLMVIELDNIERVGAELGPAAAEETIRAVGRALVRRLRKTDLVGRAGGQEFAVLLPHIDEEGAAVVAEGLSRVIPACGVDVGDTVMHPSASIGFTLVDERTASAQEALSAAAAALRARPLGIRRA